MALPAGLSQEQFNKIRDEIYSDQFKRLNHLYKIIDKSGKLTTFKLNWAQMLFFRGMHYKNIILKCRGCASLLT